MRRRRIVLVTAVVAGLAGFLAGAAFWYLASPLFIDRVVSEPLPPELMVVRRAEGVFQGADRLHRGAGTATIYGTASGGAVLRFTGFSVTNGPELRVWMVRRADISSSADVTASEWRTLGPLKGNRGDQTYILPEDIDAGDYPSVVIWCERFNVLFAVARLERAA